MKLLERDRVFSVVLPCTLQCRELLPVGGTSETQIDLSSTGCLMLCCRREDSQSGDSSICHKPLFPVITYLWRLTLHMMASFLPFSTCVGASSLWVFLCAWKDTWRQYRNSMHAARCSIDGASNCGVKWLDLYVLSATEWTETAIWLSLTGDENFRDLDCWFG